MFNVRVLMYCGYTVFGSYRNLISKKGKSLVRQENRVRPLTHYMLCQKNRLIFTEQVRDSENPGYIVIRFKEQISATDFESHELILPTMLDGKNVAVYVDVVDLDFVVWSDDGGSATSYPTFFEAILAIVQPFKFDESHCITPLLSLEVLYVGQTDITETYFRLEGHEKYAKAADDVIRTRPHKELFVKLLSYEDPTWIVQEGGEGNESKLAKIRELAKQHDHPAWVTLFEASLIYKLQPYLNVHYRRNFPSTAHGKYKQLLNIGIDSARVVIDEVKHPYCTRLIGDVYTRRLEFEFPLSL